MIQYIFPTAILSEMQLILANSMLPVAKKYLEDTSISKTKWGYTTSYGYRNPGGIADSPDIKPFKDAIEKIGRKYLKDIGYNDKELTFDTFIFVSEMFDGASHDEHTHPGSILSGLLYLQVPANSAPLIITDPRPFRQFVSLPKLEDTQTNINEITITPKAGLLVMWESWLPHLVPKSRNTDEGRITMVFNIARKLA